MSNGDSISFLVCQIDSRLLQQASAMLTRNDANSKQTWCIEVCAANSCLGLSCSSPRCRVLFHSLNSQLFITTGRFPLRSGRIFIHTGNANARAVVSLDAGTVLPGLRVRSSKILLFLQYPSVIWYIGTQKLIEDPAQAQPPSLYELPQHWKNGDA